MKRPRQTVDAIEAAEAAQEKGRAMKVITPTRIATVLGTARIPRRRARDNCNGRTGPPVDRRHDRTQRSVRRARPGDRDQHCRASDISDGSDGPALAAAIAARRTP